MEVRPLLRLRIELLTKMRRPLIYLFIALSLGLVSGYYSPFDSLVFDILKGFVIFFFLLACYLLYHRRLSVKFIVISLIFLSGFIYMQALISNWESNKIWQVIGEKIELRGRIIDVEERREGYKYLLDNLEIKGINLNKDTKILLSCWTNKGKVEYGDIISFNTSLQLPAVKRNPGGFSYRNYLRKKGVYAVTNIDSGQQLRKLSNEANLILKVIFNIKRDGKRLINNYFSTPNNYILYALLLGEKSLLPDEIEDKFRELGLSHLLVISGFHIGLISYLLHFMCSKLRLSEGLTLVIIVSFLVIYLVLTGCQLPGFRAVVLISLVLIGDYLGYKVDLYNLLAGVGIIILILNPWSLFTVSFQLSFMAVVAIAYLAPLIDEWLVFPEKMNGLLAASIAAQLGLLPLLIYYFNRISVISIVANLLIMPLITLILWVGIIFLILAVLKSSVTGLSVLLIKFTLRVVINLVDFMIGHFKTGVLIGRPSILVIIIYYLIFYYGVKFFKKDLIPYNKQSKKGLIIFCSLIILLILQTGFTDGERLEIVFLDVGNGDAIYLKTPTGQQILVDGGEDGQVLTDFLETKGIRRIDLAIVSHFHQDHVGGILKVLKEFKVDKICYPPTLNKNRLKDELVDIIDNKKIKKKELVAGDRVNIFPLRIEVLAPEIPLLEENSDNNNSLVLKLTYNKFKLLLTGDIEVAGEERILFNNLSSTVLKVGHHGSKTSSSEAFIKEVKPQLSIISVGKNNYGHPSSKVIERLLHNKSVISRTDKSGAISLWTDGRSYNYKRFLSQKRRLAN